MPIDKVWQLPEGMDLLGGQDTRSESSTQEYPLGARISLADGRVFRYSKNGAVALAAGVINASPLAGSEREDTLTAAVSAGATTFTYTAAVTMTQDEYRDGWACIVDGTGQGLQYKIKGNDAITAASTGTITLYDPIITALDTTTDVMLVKNPYSAVVVAPDQIVMVTGVAPIPVTANYYFWNQTWGIAPVLAGDALGNLATERACFLDSSNGQYVATNGGVPGAPMVGYHIFDSKDATSGDYHPIWLTIAP